MRKRLLAIRFRYAVPALCLWLAATAWTTRGETLQGPAGASYEYDVKAVFLYNFTRYLQWPEDPGGSGDFGIVVLGESEILAPLQEIAKTKHVDSKPLVVRQSFDLEQIGRPRILFIAKSTDLSVAQVLEKLQGSNILTIGEKEGLASQGLAINFVLREGTVKFEMNEKALKDAQIQTSAQLLKLAILLDENEPGGAI